MSDTRHRASSKTRANNAEDSTHVPTNSPQLVCVHRSPIKLAALIIRVMHHVAIRYTVSEVAYVSSQPCDPTWTHLAVMTRCAPSCNLEHSVRQGGGADLSSISRGSALGFCCERSPCTLGKRLSRRRVYSSQFCTRALSGRAQLTLAQKRTSCRSRPLHCSSVVQC